MNFYGYKDTALSCMNKKRYGEAVVHFEKAIETDGADDENYFFAAACLLGGREAFAAERDTVDRIEKYLREAVSINAKGIYSYFQAYIRYDYFRRRGIAMLPDFISYLLAAQKAGYSDAELACFWEMLNVVRPYAL